MSPITVLVVCPECDGGTLADGRTCGHCDGTGRYAVNRTPDGGVPHPYREWMPPMLPLPARED
jgi:DnaJ-class molecular chaperone